MRALLLPIASSAALPPSADAVIIGGGIVGVSAAYYLARRGMSVALVEKGRVGAEQSCRNWGWCRQQNRDLRELPIATRSLALWDSLSGEIGEDVGFRRSGLLYLSDNDAEIAGWAKWRDVARQAGVETLVLSAEEASARGAATGRRWRGGVFSPSDGIADPSRAAPMMARAVMRAGGSVLQDCAARGLETTGGRLSAVVTERGTIRTGVAIMAGGAWASSFLRRHGLRFPQACVRSSILAVGARGGGLAAGAAHQGGLRHRVARMAATRSRSADGGASMSPRRASATRGISCRCCASAGARSGPARWRASPPGTSAGAAGGSTGRRPWSGVASWTPRPTGA